MDMILRHLKHIPHNEENRKIAPTEDVDPM
jgi:hypothetical protein